MTTELDGIKALGQHTQNRFDPWILAGSRNAKTRAAIMAQLLNVPKVPQAQAGVTAIRARCFQIAEKRGLQFEANSCLAVRERQFVEWARKTTE